MSEAASKVWKRLWHVIRPAKTTNVVNEHGVIQSVQATFSAYETHDVLIAQMVGFASNLPVGTDLLVSNMSGDNTQGIAVASNHQAHRPKVLVGGETMIYDCGGTQQSIHLKADGTIVMTTAVGILMIAPGNVTINSPQVTVTGNLSVGTGATGAFTSAAGNTVTVVDGIITNIS